MADHFTFDEDDKKPAGPSAFSWGDDKTAPVAAAVSTTEPTQFERANTPKPYAGFTPANMLSQGWQGLKELGSSAAQMGKDVITEPWVIPEVGKETLFKKYILNPADVEAQKAQTAKTPWESVGHSVAEALPMVGPWAASLGEQAGTGDVGGALARGGTQALALKAIPKVMETAEAIPGIRARAATALTTPEGELKPIPHRLAQGGGAVAGGVVGSTIGHPWMGVGAGEYLGPQVLKGVIGKRPPIPAETELAGQPMSYAEKGEALMRRGQEQAALDREAAHQMGIPSVEAGAPVTAGVQGQPEGMPAIREPGRVGPPLQRLGELIEQAAGTKPLQPAVSLRNQLPQSVGAAAEGFPKIGEPPLQNMGGPITFRREPIVKTIPGLEEGPLRAQAPEGLPAVATEEPARQMGAPPLQPAVPLREQLKPTGMEPASKQLTLEQKYPDREVRQLVHANGEDIVQAAGNDRETLKAIHDLKNPDVRQALINSGEDMGQVSIGNRKAMGESQLSRQDAFKKLLAKGYSPKQIVDLASQEMEPVISGGKPGPMRAAGRETRREKTGD